MSGRYDKDRLKRFINDALHGEPSDDEARQAAAHALLDAYNGKDIRREMGWEPERGPVYNMDALTLDHPAFGIMTERLKNRLTAKQAKAELHRLFPTVSDRQIERYMAKLRPRAQALLDLFDPYDDK
jgi:hypothetical protein